MIKIVKTNESFIHINCDYDIALNISNHFSFFAPNYFFSPKYKMGIWDGKIKLFNLKTGLLPIGLTDLLKKYLQINDYSYELDSSLNNFGKKISSKNLISFTKKIIQSELTPRDYQISAVQRMLYLKKNIILSATGSGKSFIAFLYFNLLKYMNDNFKFLLVVPTTSLVEQMYEDFCEYGKNFTNYDHYIHRIYSGKNKETDKPIIISTWQSLQRMPESYFKQFDCVLIDECHQAQAKQLSKIVSSCTNAQYKCGMSGTLKDTKVDKMQLTSLFGNIKRVSKTKQLIKKGFLTDVKINTIILKYPLHIRKEVKNFDYNNEVSFINSLKEKQRYICKLANSRKENTLVLFRTIEYGKNLYKILEKSGRKLFYVDGSVDVKYRENIRKYCEKHNNAIIVASYGTFSTGINIKSLTNIIFAESMKSMIKIIQSIGRGLRLHKDKKKTFIFDISDDLSHGKKQNYLLKHLLARVGYYDDEDFNYTVKEIKLKR